MKNYLLPALGIIVVAIILVVINECTELTVIKDYAMVFIIGGMLLGVALTKLSGKKNKKK